MDRFLVVKGLFIVLIIWLAFAFGFVPERASNDVWWHLKTGKYIIEHDFHLPRNDVFAYTGEDIRWINHEWLTQTGFYAAYMAGESLNAGGLRTVIGLKTLVLIAAFLVVFVTIYRRCGNFWVAGFLALIATAVSRRTIYPRPPVMTYLFFALFLFLLYEYRAGRFKTWLLYIFSVPLMIIWVNSHGGFVIGFIAVGCFVVDAFANRSIRVTYFERGRYRQNLVLLFGVLLVASLINPYGIHPHLLTFKVMSESRLVSIIPELKSPDFHFTRAYEFMIVLFITGFAVLKRRTPSVAEMLLLLFFFHQSIQHMRHMPLFAIATAPLAGWVVTSSAEQIRAPSWLIRWGMTALALIFVIYSVFHHREGESYFDRNVALLRGTAFIKYNYPVEPCDFIIANKFQGSMFNQINYAGYIIWRLSPEYHKVFTDSRYDIWGDRFVWEEKLIENGVTMNEPGNNWDDLVRKYNINFMVLTGEAPLNRTLDEHGGWKMVYYWIDPRSASQYSGWRIYVKDIPENAELIERCKRSFELLQNVRRQYGFQ